MKPARLLGFVFFAICSLFLLTPKVFAISISISSSQQHINFDDEYQVTTTITTSNVADGTMYYLRGIFYKGTKSASCGVTWNNTGWYNGPISTTCQQYFPITIKNNTWSGQLKAKIDTTDTNCQTSGAYSFEVQRITTSCNGSYDGNTLAIDVSIPTPTVTPSPTQKPTPTTKPTPTEKPSPTNTPIPTVKPTITMVAVKVPLVSVLPELDTTERASASGESTSSGDILGTDTSVTPVVTKKTVVAAQHTSIFPFILVGFGIMLMISGIGVYVLFKKKQEKTSETL